MADMSSVLPRPFSSGFWEKWRDPAVRGALFKVCSCLSFSGINGFVRYFALSANETGMTPLPATELAFFETFFGLLFILPWIFSTGKSAFKVTNPLLYIARAFAASMGIILWFTALSQMPIVQVVAFKYAAPIFTVLGARLFLGEKCGWARALAIGTALSGALLITGHELFNGEADWTEVGLLALFPMGASACYVVSAVLAKKQVRNDMPQTVVLYLFLLSLPILGCACAFQWVTPLSWQWPYLIVMGSLLAAAYIFLQHAYVIADITYLVPMSFTRLIAGAAIGMIFFSEWPTLWTFLGSFFILLATISLCKHEVQQMKTKQTLPLPAVA
jgi:drug/metabolite transporter (DMT)-like permease